MGRSPRSAPRVLRESVTVQNRPVGVVRASSGGAFAESASRALGTVSEGIYKRAAQDAQRAGRDQALALDDVTSIDPETGAPVVLKNIGEMGRIQSDAYSRVVESRYLQDIEEEIRARSTMVVEEVSKHSNSADRYAAVMSDYLSKMAEGAEGKWAGYIQDSGSAFVTQATATLAARDLRRQRSALAASSKRAQAEAQDSAYNHMVQNGSLEGFGDLIVQTANNGAQDAVDAGVFDQDELNEMNEKMRRAILSGAVQYELRGIDPNDEGAVEKINKITAALLIGDPEQIAETMPSLAPFAEDFLRDPSMASYLFRESNNAIRGVGILAEAEVSRRAKEQERQDLINEEIGLSEANAVRQMFAQGSSKAITLKPPTGFEDKYYKAALEGLAQGMMRGKNVEEVESLISELQVGKIDNSDLAILVDRSRMYIENPAKIVLDRLISYKANGAKFQQDERETAAYQSVVSSGFYDSLNLITSDDKLDQVIGSLPEDLSDSDRSDFERAAQRRYAQKLIERSYSKSDPELIDQYIDGQGGLPSGSQVASDLERARSLLVQAGQPAEFNTHAGRVSAQRRAMIAEQKREEEKNRLIGQAGQGVGGTIDAIEFRRNQDAFLAAKLNYPDKLPANFWVSRDLKIEADRRIALSIISQTPNFMPESLKQTMESAANGTASFMDIVPLYQQLKFADIQGSLAPGIFNSALGVLSSEDRLRLDLIASLSETRDLQDAYNSLNFVDEFEDDSIPERSWGEWIGGNPDYEELVAKLNTEDLTAVKSFIAFTLRQEKLGMGDASKVIKSFLEQGYHDSNGDVYDMSSDGLMSTVSEWSLSRIIPEHQSEFRAFALREYLNATGKMAIFDSEAGISDPVATVSKIVGYKELGFTEEEAVELQKMGLDPDSPRIALMPYGRDAMGGVTYFVMNRHLGDLSVVYTELGQPLMISTVEPEFKNMLPEKELPERTGNPISQGSINRITPSIILEGDSPPSSGGSFIRAQNRNK